jgi:Predicted membrane protein (DUF2306)
MKLSIRNTARGLALLVLGLLCLGVTWHAFSYLYGEFQPRNPIARSFASGGLGVPAHFYFAGLALALAPLQLSGALRRRWPRLHRLAGWLYTLCVVIGGLGALALAPRAQGGWASGSGFLLLALLWLGFTVAGVACAVRGDYVRHRAWLCRSVALTTSAVTLRLMLGVGLGVLHLPFLKVYITAAWASWLFNLAVCECLLRWPAWRAWLRRPALASAASAA